MKRFMNFKGTIENFIYDSTAHSIDVSITPEDVVIFHMELQLIIFEHAESLTIKPANKHNEIKLQLAVDEKTKIEVLENNYHIQMSKDDLKVIAAYLLTYYGGESSLQGHLDLEMETIRQPELDTTMILAIVEK